MTEASGFSSRSNGSTGPQSRIYRVGIRSGAVTLVAKDLVSAVGLDVSKKGHIFVSQLFTGQIAKIAKGSSVARRGSPPR